jgi:acyl-CoA thioesterase-1
VILYHVYSGHLFFTAAALFAVGVLVPRLRVLTLLAIPLAAFSGTPVPWFVLVLFAAGATAYFVVRNRWTQIAAIAVAAVAVAFELPYHLARPRVLIPTRLFVIGDSLASGGFGEKATWPARLGAINLARPADTSAAAREQLALLPPLANDDCVIIELGGNDMLGGVSAATFAEALDQILAGAQPRRLVMLELPLLPGKWSYGAAQRRLAREHGVVLVPKRILAGVLADARNTSDGAHLTERGHAQLARDLARWLRWPQ